jgi:molecular chaperone GrpE
MMSQDSSNRNNTQDIDMPENPSNDSVFESMENDSFDSANLETPEQIVDLLEQQVADLKERELKAQAELENFRKRILRDTEQQLKYALLPFVRDLLEIVDNLNRATDAASSNNSAEGLVAGVKLVQHQLHQVLAKYSCKPIESVGQTFDPNFHQAIAQQPSNDYAAGKVMMETSVGYIMHDRVIRPSMVIVSTGPATEAS